MAGDLGKNWDDATKKAKLYSDAIEASNKKAEKHSQFLSSIAEEMGIAYGSFKKQVEKTLEQRREEERILSNISLKSKEINREISKGNNEILKANEIQIKRISLEDVYAQKNIDTNRTFEDFNKTLNEALKIEKEKGKLTDEQSKALDFQKEILEERELINNNNSNNLKESIKSNEILKTVLESQGVDIENNSDLQEGLNKLSNDALYGVQGQLKAIANIEEKKRIGLELSEDELDVYKELKPLQGALEEKEKNIVKIKKEEERAQENVNQKMRDVIDLSGDWTKGIAKDMWGAMKSFDKAVSDAGKNFGFIQDHSWGTSAQMSVLNSEAARFNMSSEDTMNMMGQLGDELKTIDQRHLANSVKHFIAIEKATGISSDEITTIAGEMMRAGKSAEDVENYMEGANHTAKMFGVNTKKVLQGVARNIDKMRQMGFKGGEESLTRMVATAERLRINVDEIFDVAKKARTIEGAMDMAAELQLAGGSFANIDPMSLLAAARKDPEELKKILTQMGGGYWKI